MKRIETGRHLHSLHFVHGLASGIEGSAELKRRTSVGIVVLNDEILHFFGIDERGGERMLLRLDIFVVLKAVGGKKFLDLHVRPRGNLVYHSPRECHFLLIPKIVEEALLNESVSHPFLGIGKYTGLDLVSVVGTVVHTLDGERKPARLVALIEQSGDFTHSKNGLESTLKVCRRYAISFFRNCE